MGGGGGFVALCAYGGCAELLRALQVVTESVLFVWCDAHVMLDLQRGIVSQHARGQLCVDAFVASASAVVECVKRQLARGKGWKDGPALSA